MRRNTGGSGGGGREEGAELSRRAGEGQAPFGAPWLWSGSAYPPMGGGGGASAPRSARGLAAACGCGQSGIRCGGGGLSVGRSARSGHDGAQLCAAACSLLRLLGPRGHRRPLVRAQGAESRGDHHDAGHHRRVLLPFLAHRDPGPGQPPVRAAAEERDHLVRALPLGVSSPQEPVPEQKPPHLNHHPHAAVSASYTKHPPRGPGTEAGPSAPAHPEHCNLDQSLSTGGSTPG